MVDETFPSYERQRHEMVTWQIEKRGILDARLLQALRSVPRHRFVPAEQRSSAYEDYPLQIGFGQTISQPYIVALMTDLLHLEGSEQVLEIGTGSGYQAAVLGCLARQVHTIEYIPELARRARRLLDELGYVNITVHEGDGSAGLPEFGPYQGILVTAAAPGVPDPLLKQLAFGGCLVLPAGGRYNQVLEVWRTVEGGFEHEAITPVAFVPLRGSWGWKEP